MPLARTLLVHPLSLHLEILMSYEVVEKICGGVVTGSTVDTMTGAVSQKNGTSIS